MKNIVLAAILAAPVALLPCAAEASGRGTITDIVAQSGGDFDHNPKDFDILLNAVLAAGLEGALADRSADLTVFAPTDAAFVQLARDFGMKGNSEEQAFATIVAALTEIGGGDPIPVLTNVLLYHVSAGAKTTKEVSEAGVLDTLLASGTIVPAYWRLLDNEPDLTNPAILWYADNIRAKNGIIHAISRVLIPVDLPNTDSDSLPTIAGLLAESGGSFDTNTLDFDILLTALDAAGLTDALDSPGDNLTLLAPTDRAFIISARDLGYAGFNEAEATAFILDVLTDLGGGDPIPLLTDILLYHVVPEELSAKGALERPTLDTLLTGVSIRPWPQRVALRDEEPGLPNARMKVIAESDNRVSNGFVHGISRLLIPVDLPGVTSNRKD
jgi:uncharacterized surface protein with fasciclin (FAS1) repeats